MAQVSEILFVDSSVSDLETILGNLRPEVHAVVLNERQSAARQMAAALEGRQGLDAVHIIAHGASGRVVFAAGEWSAATVARDTADLTAIGRALADDGQLRLWSCNTSAGESGAVFVSALRQVVGAEVRAAAALVGASALGGVWELTVGVPCAPAEPPLGRFGISTYAGILANNF
jgi:hypothetical protein